MSKSISTLFLSLLIIPIILLASTLSFTLITSIDCQAQGCQANNTDGDTIYWGAWGSSGNFVYNGSPIAGGVIGTWNDGSYPTCNASGQNIGIQRLTGVDFVTPSNGGNTLINCLSSFGTGASQAWSPATSGTCSATHTNGCTWKSVGITRYNGNLYLYVFRQDGGNNAALDATIMLSTDDGVTWANSVHLGSPNANGDAPTGPGSADYPANIMFPGLGPTDGSGNHRARMQFVHYCKDETIGCPSIDNNATYLYAVNTNGDFQGNSFMRVTKVNVPNLVGSNWEYYTCPTYPSPICDITDPGSWTSTATSQSNLSIFPGANPFIVWDNAKSVYISVGFNGGNGAYYLVTAPHLAGPWTTNGSFVPNCTSGGCSVFTSIIQPTITETDSTNTRFVVGSDSANIHSASGTMYFDLINMLLTNSASVGVSGKSIIKGKTTVH